MIWRWHRASGRLFVRTTDWRRSEDRVPPAVCRPGKPDPFGGERLQLRACRRSRSAQRECGPDRSPGEAEPPWTGPARDGRWKTRGGMHPDLARIISELRAAEERARELAEESSEAGWQERPEASEWSAAECVAHLNLTSEAYLPLLEEGLNRARADGGPSPSRFRRDPFGWMLGKATGPGGRIKMKTAAAFVPGATVPREEVIREFSRLQGQVIDVIERADGLALQRVKVTSPFDPRAKYSLYSALMLIPAHQQRHLRQAERALSRVKV
ncbi:MAG: hypothetical protein GEU90_05580 [Gemmatimonas sp.]|nr:hypothetical protein [Gemmatimonas sp.]